MFVRVGDRHRGWQLEQRPRGFGHIPRSRRPFSPAGALFHLLPRSPFAFTLARWLHQLRSISYGTCARVDQSFTYDTGSLVAWPIVFAPGVMLKSPNRRRSSVITTHHIRHYGGGSLDV